MRMSLPNIHFVFPLQLISQLNTTLQGLSNRVSTFPNLVSHLNGMWFIYVSRGAVVWGQEGGHTEVYGRGFVW